MVRSTSHGGVMPRSARALLRAPGKHPNRHALRNPAAEDPSSYGKIQAAYGHAA